MRVGRDSPEQIRRREVSRALKKINLSPEEEEAIERLSRSLVGKLLHGPISRVMACAEVEFSSVGRPGPEAVFLPGHGPLARADDLRRHADYLEFLQESVDQALRDGLGEDEAVERIDLSGWDLSILPSFRGGRLTWATGKSNVRWAYQMSKGQRGT
jgi:hypothetical protein